MDRTLTHTFSKLLQSAASDWAPAGGKSLFFCRLTDKSLSLREREVDREKEKEREREREPERDSLGEGDFAYSLYAASAYLHINFCKHL
jgi:hypothetical protein